MTAGTVATLEALFVPGGGLRRLVVPSLCFLLEHPREGPILFDSGYTPRFLTATRRFPARLYRMATPVTIGDADTAVAQLARRGIAAADVRWIILSHFDPDHYGGLVDFPRAKIVCHAQAWSDVRGKTGILALVHRIIPECLPADLEGRLHLLSGPGVVPLPAPLGRGFDLFGDGAVRLVALPGHAPGHLGALIEDDARGPMLLAADSCWHSRTFTAPGATRTPHAAAHGLIARDRRAQAQTYRLLARLHGARPEVTIVPSHCPEAARGLRATQPQEVLA